jgi:hypothetical protein
MIRPAVLAYWLLLYGCATRPAEAPTPCGAHECAPRRICLAVSGDFGDAERADVLAAAADWRLALGGAVDFSCELESAEVVTIERGFISTCGERTSGVILGCTAGSSVVIDPETHGPVFVETVSHELGHVLGLHHVGSGVMAPMVTGTSKPGRQEAAAFMAAKGCCL